jgi:hypothetical protein
LNKNIREILFIFAVICLLFFNGCENNLSDEGIGYIASDTLGTLILDSQPDSIQINVGSFIYNINTSSSANMLVGKYSNYESRTLLKFTGLGSVYDTNAVLSAKLNIRYNNTYYQDSLGITSFNIYRLNKPYDLSTIKNDQFYSISTGSSVLGSYTGTPKDTSLISITLDNQTVKEWLLYAHDTTSIYKNYGMALYPNAGSTTIKSFCSGNYSTYSDFYPTLTIIILESTGQQDTLTYSSTTFTTLNNAPQISNIQERIIVQNGISQRDYIKFDVSKLPSKVIINQAALVLHLDTLNSFYTTGIDKRLTFHMLTDSATLATDGNIYYATITDSTIFTGYLNLAVQEWNYGTYSNLGIYIKNIYDYSNLDKYVFYGPDCPDVSKRPRLKIRYTIRN